MPGEVLRRIPGNDSLKVLRVGIVYSDNGKRGSKSGIAYLILSLAGLNLNPLG
jgi:hypothetical protein